MNKPTPSFLTALSNQKPLQIAGTINAYSALLAERAGFNAIYLSGAGVANASFGIPDLGFTTLEQVAEDARRICHVSNLPLLVDIDTAWDDPALTINTMIDVGVSAVHMEDQVSMKRCGHRDGKKLVTCDEMQNRIKIAVTARNSNSMIIMARTDACSVEGFDAAIDRSLAYIDAGADMIFAEAFESLDQYKFFCEKMSVPVLANMTEFGKTPYYSLEDFNTVGVDMVLYPLSAFRAMSAATLQVYNTIKHEGSQQSCLDNMQTRAELYDVLNYEKFEKEMDDQFHKSGESE